jgi:hypothetical protein
MAQEPDDTTGRLQARDIDVQVDPIDAIGPERSEWIRVT